MRRGVPSLISLLVVIAAYQIYARVAVPRIELSVAWAEGDLPPIEGPSSDPDDRPPFANLFPAGHWVFGTSKMVESDQLKLLIDDYTDLGDGRVHLEPCVLIHTPNGAATLPEERYDNAIVMEAPAGAILQFDKPLDLSRAEIGRVIGGHLEGRIEVRGAGDPNTRDDDLWLVTSDLHISEEQIWTDSAQPVEFRFGQSWGRGQGISAELLPAAKADKYGPNIGGIERFELRRLERLHLEPSPKTVKALASDAQDSGSPSGSDNPIKSFDAELPLEISCRGPFQHDFLLREAVFQKHVDVLRLHPIGPSDQLSCELLTLYFDAKQPEEGEEEGDSAVTPPGSKRRHRRRDRSAKPATPNPFALTLRSIVAEGLPVIVRSPAGGIEEARGEKLTFDRVSGLLTLSGQREVFLRGYPKKSGGSALGGFLGGGATPEASNTSAQPMEIRARNLQFRPAESEGMVYVMAEGPGLLRADVGDEMGRMAVARFQGAARVRPHQNQHVISLTGGASLELEGMGRVTSREMHVWLAKTVDPSDPDRIDWQPDRMLVLGDVQLASIMLAGRVNRWETWFKHPREIPQATSASAGTSPPARSTANTPVARSTQTHATNQGDPLTPPLTPPPTPPLTPPPTPPPTRSTGSRLANLAKLQRHFDVTGQTLQTQILLHPQPKDTPAPNPRQQPDPDDSLAELTELTLLGNVRLVETRTALPGQQPIVIVGERIQMVDASRPHAAVTISGKNATFQGSGLTLAGDNINVNRGTGRAWIDGPGSAMLSIDRDLKNQPLDVPSQLKINWEQRMTFDGKTIQFVKSVVARNRSADGLQTQDIRTQQLDVTFVEAIQFDQLDGGRPPPTDLERLSCHGGVFLETEMLDTSGQRTSIEKIWARDIDINAVTGKIEATGPGEVRSTRHDDGSGPEGFSGLSELRGTTSRPKPTSGSDDSLSYINVRFQRRIEGNLHQEHVAFVGRVETTYGPVVDWGQTLDPRDPNGVGEDAFVLECDRLGITQMPSPTDDDKYIELEATGNTATRGDTFTARAARMTYDESKDLLVLEGDSQTDAEFYRQQFHGGPADPVAQAHRIHYSLKTKALSVDGARGMEFRQRSAH